MMKPKPSERIRERTEQIHEQNEFERLPKDVRPVLAAIEAILEFLDEHLFESRPVEERELTGCTECGAHAILADTEDDDRPLCCECASVIPEDAEEFESDGMRALRFTDTEGLGQEVRVTGPDSWERRLLPGTSWERLLEEDVGDETAMSEPAFDWLRSVWAEMRDEPIRNPAPKCNQGPEMQPTSENATAEPKELTDTERLQLERKRLIEANTEAYLSERADGRVVPSPTCKCICGSKKFADGMRAVSLKRPPHMYPTERGDVIEIDRCVAPVVEYLWERGIWTMGSCCGHDGRMSGPSVCVAPECEAEMVRLGYAPMDGCPGCFLVHACAPTKSSEVSSSSVVEPKERGNGDALEILKAITEHKEWNATTQEWEPTDAAYMAERAYDALDAERARHAEEVERLKARLKSISEYCYKVSVPDREGPVDPEDEPEILAPNVTYLADTILELAKGRKPRDDPSPPKSDAKRIAELEAEQEARRKGGENYMDEIFHALDIKGIAHVDTPTFLDGVTGLKARAEKAEARVRELEAFERDAKRLPEYVRGNDELRKRETEQASRIAELESKLEEAEKELEAARVVTAGLESQLEEAGKREESLRGEIELTADGEYRLTLERVNRELREELGNVRKLESDMKAAAGELTVPMPESGTDASRLLGANVLLRRERDTLRRERDELEHSRDFWRKRTAESLECPFCDGTGDCSYCDDGEVPSGESQPECMETLRTRAETAESQLADLQAKYAELAGGSMPGFGVHPDDSFALSTLRTCIDTHGIWPDEETEDTGDYEVCIEHMAKMLREKACLFSETVRMDAYDNGNKYQVPVPRRFTGHCLRVTFSALYPIGERIEAGTMEGRDS